MSQTQQDSSLFSASMCKVRAEIIKIVYNARREPLPHQRSLPTSAFSHLPDLRQGRLLLCGCPLGKGDKDPPHLSQGFLTLTKHLGWSAVKEVRVCLAVASAQVGSVASRPAVGQWECVAEGKEPGPQIPLRVNAFKALRSIYRGLLPF